MGSFEILKPCELTAEEQARIATDKEINHEVVLNFIATAKRLDLVSRDSEKSQPEEKRLLRDI